MNAFVRQLAALSALWALCEVLLPDGRRQRLARLAVSALVLASLATSLGGLAGKTIDLGWDAPAPAAQGFDGEDGGARYRRAALTALANQVRGFCERFARNAGYAAQATASLRMDGALDHVRLSLQAAENQRPLLAPQEVARRLAELLQADEAAIRLVDGALNE